MPSKWITIRLIDFNVYHNKVAMLFKSRMRVTSLELEYSLSLR